MIKKYSFVNHRIVLYLILGCVVVCGVWYSFDVRQAIDVGAVDLSLPQMSNNLLKEVAVGEGKTTNRLSRLPVDSTVPTVLPQSLAGSIAPPLPLDAYGHLARVSAVRDFFDYFLTAQNDLTPAALDELVTHEIVKQLHGTSAQVEAQDVWTRYCAYFSQLVKLPDMGMVLGDKLDFVAVQRALDQRSSLAVRTLGDWSEPFFGAEQQRQRYDLERLKIADDQALTDEQKKKRLVALEQKLPSKVQEERIKIQQQQDAVVKIIQLQKDEVTPDGIRLQVVGLLGPEVAYRVVEMRRQDEIWQEKYKHYAAQRAQIEAQQLEPKEHDVQVENLRQRIFTKPGEALHAASLDQ
ncbi:lipase chaperone [Xylella fastidiosa Mul-MD]|uniref:lipase secretion chaperone n=1 Tax=Xylella fastidiosa TaxID=2371 RepID=UPI0003ED01FC|nr:lipase secretion chaperone [Xylella fastidiosa]EWG14670.1 lipase chaperone [Xylella fastidiosa Mul-MD]